MPKRKARHNLQLRPTARFISRNVFQPTVALIGLLVSPLALGEEPAQEYVDWVPREQLSPAEQAQLEPFCRGAFREPEPEHEEADLDPQLAPIRIEADQTSVTNASQILLEGRVDIRQGSRSLQADRISYNRNTDAAGLTGGVVIRQPGTLIQGDEAHVDMSGNDALFINSEFLLHEQHMRGGAERIEQTENKVIILTNGRVTTCEPVEESWVLEGGKLKLDPENAQGSGRNLFLRFKGVPVLYIPYIRFPLGDERQSGFLFPVASYSQSDGLDLAVPYYFNLAPNYDLTLTPRFISERGSMLEAEGRHLSQLFSTRASAAYLPNDRGSRDPDYDDIVNSGLATEEELQPFVGQDRWLVGFNQLGGRDRPWYTRVDYNAVSDIDYFRDLDTTSFSVASSTYLNQSAEAGYIFPNWHLQARLQDYQTLLRGLDETYRQLPRLSADGRYRWGDVALTLNNEYVYFDHSHDFRTGGRPIITGQRARADYRLTWDRSWQWGFVRPQVGAQHLSYQLDGEPLTTGDTASPAMTAGQASVDLGLIFDRPDPQGLLRQTLEPRLFYLYRERADHSALYSVTDAQQYVNFDTTPLNFTYSQLFRDSRFSGGDRIDDANQLAIGLTSRWYGGERNREIVTASAGQIFYLDDRMVTLTGEPDRASTSQIATQVSSAITETIDVRADLLLDDRNRRISRGSVFGHYKDVHKLYNLGYRYISNDAIGATSDDDVEQLEFSFSAAINGQWRTFGRTNYDIGDNRELELFAGFEYNDCCYGVRVLARRWLDSKIADLITDKSLEYDQGIFFEIQLRGLGGTGDRVRTILEDSIVGFRDQQLHFNH